MTFTNEVEIGKKIFDHAASFGLVIWPFTLSKISNLVLYVSNNGL